MRIAYIINSLEGGGAAFPVPDITGVLRRAGHEVAVFALLRRDGRALPALQAAGLPVEICPGGRRDHLAALRWLNQQIGHWRPDLLWTSLTRATVLGQMVGLRHRIPVVSWQHSAGLSPANTRLLRNLRRLSRIWVADSTCVLDFMRHRLHIPADRAALWPIFRADPACPVAHPWQAGEIVRIGSLGRLHPVKGYDILCQALALLKTDRSLPPFRVTIAGEGDARPQIEGLIRDHGLTTLHLAGFTNAVPDFLSTQHGYVQPSRHEGLCIGVHQAMQAGLAPVASSVGEIPYTVQDGLSGLLVPPADPVALADALARMLRQPQALATMGQAARTRVQTLFAPERFDEAGQAILDRIAASQRG
ncbi:glycosyltransferase family 4 protein [Gluconacetobacter takamatsuzukensis]|uniref:Glycosyltransferase family 4 protein n=1 Tax=Gluconacetobacter takamatsuzukensis TaxID=1286190 RepID=A0A7W4KG65_9PROT|nr:glycosyltransferase family 4 protein [Gluconacetobacter takamatsuzukensis]MBB2206359.1 glycosyltransferase family 4 protein [Gluconacetobacter takamatsuzukensis]